MHADIDECSQESNTCNVETEVCQNLVGTHLCKCKQGLVRVDGKCVPEPEKPAPTQPPPTKKSKKKKKKSKKGKEKGPLMFPWYHTVAPLMLLFLTYKYAKPNLVTSGMILLVLAIAACS